MDRTNLWLKFLIVSSVILFSFIIGTAQAVTVGQTFSQQQLDAASDAQILNNIELGLQNIRLDNTNLQYILTITTVEPYIVEFGKQPGPGEDYIIVQKKFVVNFPILRVIQCVTLLGLEDCKQQKIKPVILEKARKAKQTSFQNIKDFQTQSNLTKRDFENLITKQELNS